MMVFMIGAEYMISGVFAKFSIDRSLGITQTCDVEILIMARGLLRDTNLEGFCFSCFAYSTFISTSTNPYVKIKICVTPESIKSI